MDIAIKITLVASIVLVGYNLHQLVTSYEAICEKVKEFNNFFVELCDATIKDEFGIENNVLRLFESVLSDNLANYLTAGINTFLKGRYNPTDVVEDVPFFYPIIGVIRHNLLKNLRNDVISKFNQ